MKVLCLDPGETTGWALLHIAGDDPGTLTFSTGVISSNSQELTRKLNALMKWKPDAVVCERLPDRLNVRLRRVMEAILCRFPSHTITFYGPGEWKPVTGNLPIPPKNRTPWTYMTHERDAYRMGMYHLRVIRSKPNGVTGS